MSELSEYVSKYGDNITRIVVTELREQRETLDKLRAKVDCDVEAQAIRLEQFQQIVAEKDARIAELEDAIEFYLSRLWDAERIANEAMRVGLEFGDAMGKARAGRKSR